MHTAIVKLDALPDAVGAAAQHHDFFAIRGCRFALRAFGLIGGIQVRGVGAEFGGTGIHPLVDRAHTEGAAAFAHGAVGGLELTRQPPVRKAFLLEGAQRGCVHGVQRAAAGRLGQALDVELEFDDLLNLRQKPGVDFGERVHLLHAHTLRETVTHVPDALRAGLAQFFFQHFAVLGFLIHAVHADFQAAQGFLERLLESAAHGHHLANRFHLGGQAAVSSGEFFKRKARDLGDHVVNAGLEAGRRGTAGYVVAQLIQGKANSQFGGHFGDWKAGRFGRQCRGARDPRIHLDHHHAPVLRVDGELHVGATRVHANLAQHGQAGVAQNLVFLVAQRLRRCHGNRVAGVHAHGVQVFNRADDDAVVGLVAHHLHLEFFPAQQRLFDEQLFRGRGLQAALANGLEFFGVVGNASAGSAQGETGADHGGKPQSFLRAPRLVHAVGDARARRSQSDLGHGVFEFQTVFGFVNGLRGCADQLDLVLLQHALVPQIECAIERGLAAHGRQNRIGPFLGNDFFYRLPGYRLDVGHIGRGRVGHDGGGVAVDQDDLVALLAQSLAGLHARVVELAGLADDDGAGTDDQDAV